jgi:hypothetical protein
MCAPYTRKVLHFKFDRALEETLADIGLAARWPAQLIDARLLEITIPPGDDVLTSGDAVAAGDFGKLVARVLVGPNAD